MPVCSTCKHDKPLDEFFTRKRAKSGITSSCKGCVLEQNRKSYQNTKYRTIEVRKQRCSNYVNKLREHVDSIKHISGCYFCDESEPCCLDFHHIDNTTKDKSISTLISSHVSIARLDIEIAKCVVLCANCHRKLHAGLLTITSDAT